MLLLQCMPHLVAVVTEAATGVEASGRRVAAARSTGGKVGAAALQSVADAAAASPPFSPRPPAAGVVLIRVRRAVRVGVLYGCACVVGGGREEDGRRSAARRREIAALAGRTDTLVFFESPRRLVAALADLAAILGPRAAVVGRELTKKFEEIVRGDLSELTRRFAERAEKASLKGEIAIAVAGVSDDVE